MNWALKKSDTVACPVLNHGPSFPVNNIYCVGRNYSEHAKEMGGNPDREPPFFFHKISEILLPPGNDLKFPDDTKELHYEVELVVALGSKGFKILKEQSKDLIFGYAVGVDLTKRDIQKNAKDAGRPWMSGKVFFGSAAISDIVRKEESEEPDNIEISLSINDIIRWKFYN